MKRTLFGLALALGTAACTSVGPLGTAEFDTLVEQASGVKPAQAVLGSRVSLMATDMDFCWVPLHVSKHCSEAQLRIMHLFRGEKRVHQSWQGVLVATRDELVFLEWNEQRRGYSKLDAVAIRNIDAMEVYRFGLSRTLRLTARDSKNVYYVFTLMGPSGQAQDSAMNDKLFAHLRGPLRARGARIVEI